MAKINFERPSLQLKKKLQKTSKDYKDFKLEPDGRDLSSPPKPYENNSFNIEQLANDFHDLHASLQATELIEQRRERGDSIGKKYFELADNLESKKDVIIKELELPLTNAILNTLTKGTDGDALAIDWYTHWSHYLCNRYEKPIGFFDKTHEYIWDSFLENLTLKDN